MTTKTAIFIISCDANPRGYIQYANNAVSKVFTTKAGAHNEIAQAYVLGLISDSDLLLLMAEINNSPLLGDGITVDDICEP